jgi:hypothetical protein
MNASVSLLPFAPAASAGETSAVPPASSKSQSSAPFSRMLDHAVQEPPGRHPNANRSSRQTDHAPRTRAKEQTRDEFQNERRELPRVKTRKPERDDQESLAGACAVNGQATPLEPVASPNANGESKTITAVSEETSDPNSTAAQDSVTTNSADETSAETESGSLWTEVISELTPASETDAQPVLSEVLAPTTEATPAMLPPVTAKSVSTMDSVALNLANSMDELSSELLSPPVQSAAEATAINHPIGATEALAAVPTESLEAEEIKTGAPVLTSTAMTAISEEARRVARATRQARTDFLENTSGTGGAKSNATMKTAIKKEEVAGSAQQFLPGSPASAVPPLRNLPGSFQRNAHSISGAEALEAAKGIPTPTRAEGTGNLESVAPATGTMARVTEVISREVRMFKRGGDDLVEVVLTPDTKTQISLRLQWRDGQVEVQARCDLGDYQSLNTQWTQLQTSLAGHGVRLSHLSERATTGFTEFFNYSSFNQNPQRDPQSHRPVELPEILPVAPAPVVRAATPATAAVRSNRALDYWA